jgi:hypothetical protein
MNEYPDNLCHVNRTTGTTYALSKRLNIYKNFERLKYSLTHATRPQTSRDILAHWKTFPPIVGKQASHL